MNGGSFKEAWSQCVVNVTNTSLQRGENINDAQNADSVMFAGGWGLW